MERAESRWYVYMVRCRDRTLYTGITTDIERRLTEHNTGVGAKYTRSRRPVVLVYLEEHPSRSAAAKREYAIKKMDLAAKKQLLSQKRG
jgi:predicted GIY-YIG superfamily endonuclease